MNGFRAVGAPRVSLGKEGDRIAEVIGFDAAVRLIRALPPAGSRAWRRCLYVPAQMTVDHMVAREIGLPLARRLSEAFGGMILQPAHDGRVSRRLKELAVLSRRRAGHTVQEIACDLDMPVSTVRSILARITADLP